MMRFEDNRGVGHFVDPRRIIAVEPVFKKDGEGKSEPDPDEEHCQLIIEGGLTHVIRGAQPAVASAVTQKAYQAQLVTLRDGIAPAMKAFAKQLSES
jgi:hypothetical protein